MKEESKIPMPHILSGTSFQFERWKVYGIVGKNGAGKTSLMYLLAWFFRWYDGEILFNGENTKDFTTTSFLEKISFLTQIPFNIEREATVRDNLFLWVWDDKTDEKAWEYLELFWLAHKIKKTKKWLDSEIGNNLSFSGWEYQILSFIRILLQDKDIVILDEWTNQLDAENEILVMNELLKHKQNKIIIFITHRMSTISRADEIYCLEDGKFSSKWTHIELMKENTNMYAKFYRAQVLHIN
jgi:ABC-type multidrug transport system fused ATPase/permease subunit